MVVRRAADIEVDRPARGDCDVLERMDVVARGVEAREVGGDHRASAADAVDAPGIPVDLVGFADIEDPVAGEVGERHALRRVQPG